MWNKLIYILVLSIVLLTACSQNTELTIRQEMYDEALEYYNLMNERINDAKDITQEEYNKISFFTTSKYPDLKVLNEKEQKLVLRVLSMLASFTMVHTAHKINDDKLLKESIAAYVSDKTEVGKLLNVESE